MAFETTIRERLQSLIEIHSPTGYHLDVMKYIESTLNSMDVPFKTTTKGAVLVTLPGKSEEGRLFSAQPRIKT